MKKLLDNIKKWIESLFKDKDFNDDEVVFSTEEYIEDEEDNPSFSLWYGEIKREYRNIKWVWHKNDEDMWPSFPHLHALERPYKMDIYTGTIYNKQKQDIDKLSSKEMNFLWKDKNFYLMLTIKEITMKSLYMMEIDINLYLNALMKNMNKYNNLINQIVSGNRTNFTIA